MNYVESYQGVFGVRHRTAVVVTPWARRERVGVAGRPGLTQDSPESWLRLMQTFRISEAKRNFGKLFARAKRGEVVVLQNGSDFMQLVPFVLPEPVPLRPVGYFQPSDEEIARINAAPADSGPLR